MHAELEHKDFFEISNHCTDETEQYFVRVIGCIESIIMEEKLQNLMKDFMEEHWEEFDNKEENKLVYMDIFKKYIGTIEKHIEERLQTLLPDFHMSTFETELRKRKHELDGEIFEMLMSFSDFKTFKQMFIEYKDMKEGNNIDFSRDIIINKYCVKN